MRCRKRLLMTLLTVNAGLTGCSTSQEAVLPQPDTNVEQVWQETMQGEMSEYQALGALKRPLTPQTLAARQSDYTRDSWRETLNLFPRLPNPDVVMYILPHRVGNLPVPGYSTVFPLYERVHYATPAEAPAILPREAW
ncbi:TIGR03751 family conjugal transfer lipoprotein [Vibrio sinensis]|uniref:TIGR03751 family conjugal transfer lipoprotein n=1 Tax=Vibrio sinensis TaxID=2302434 RepID=A0A3A6QZJ4_9VIBR|nr:TIGR03751 family conjugal transfer lipoprotein [Vibrio sinensis]RJX68675.1 TIGR03751 family conjugal transfer lipoprotein [Vibrio sinensis]